jgi:hypothetical protein
MSKLILGFLGVMMLALPQAAGAQSFGGDYKYVAKFLCGRHDDEEQGIGVVMGHYNTIINVTALKNRTAAVFRSTWLAENFNDDCEIIDRGVPSDYSSRVDLDRDEAVAITCNDIKFSLGERCQGFVEGLVTIYSSRPLAVSDVITGQGTDDGDYPLSVMQVLDVREVKTSEKITPQEQPQM